MTLYVLLSHHDSNGEGYFQSEIKAIYQTKEAAEGAMKALEYDYPPDRDYYFSIQTHQLIEDTIDQLHVDIFKFLLSHDLMPVILPSIKEMGKYKGGFGLVKRISSYGGLKEVRKSYASYIMEKYPISSWHADPS